MLAYESRDRWTMTFTEDGGKTCSPYEVLFSCRDAATDLPYVVCRPWDGDRPGDGEPECLAVTVHGDESSSKNVVCIPVTADPQVAAEVMQAFHGGDTV